MASRGQDEGGGWEVVAAMKKGLQRKPHEANREEHEAAELCSLNRTFKW